MHFSFCFLRAREQQPQKLFHIIKQNEESAIIVAGGLGHDDIPLKSVEMFLASQNQWVILGSLESPRSWYPSLFILNKRLTCIGGTVRQKTCMKFRILDFTLYHECSR